MYTLLKIMYSSFIMNYLSYNDFGWSPTFLYHTNSDVRFMEPITIYYSKPHLTEYNIELPVSFDAREKWGDLISGISNQGECGSCWAFATSSVLSDRYNIQTGSSVKLSVQDLVSCDIFDTSCNGGEGNTSFYFIENYGITDNQCKRYKGVNGTCSDFCDDGSKVSKDYKVSDIYNVVDLYDDIETRVKKMKTELITNGPIYVGFDVYEDFKLYKSGVYKHVIGEKIGSHAVRLIGYDDLTGSWTIANSWGVTWGEEGYFRIRMGSNECNLENEAWGGLFIY